MSIEVKDFDLCVDLNASCAGCSSSCIDVALVSDNVRILLCEDCLKQLRNDIDGKINKVSHFCRHCAYFTADKYEPSKHDGKCQLQPNVMCDPRNSCKYFVQKYTIKGNIDELKDSNDYHLNPLGEKNDIQKEIKSIILDKELSDKEVKELEELYKKQEAEGFKVTRYYGD